MLNKYSIKVMMLHFIFRDFCIIVILCEFNKIFRWMTLESLSVLDTKKWWLFSHAVHSLQITPKTPQMTITVKQSIHCYNQEKNQLVLVEYWNLSTSWNQGIRFSLQWERIMYGSIVFVKWMNVGICSNGGGGNRFHSCYVLQYL